MSHKPGQLSAIAQPRILVGWKAIAAYLQMGIRTVQRHERAHGLPIRRPAGQPTGAVIATVEELDAWVAASPLRAAFRLSTPKALSADTAMEALRMSMNETARLRDEMCRLRQEVRVSLDRLYSTIKAVDAKPPQHWHETGNHRRHKTVSDLLLFDTSGRKIV